ncbi:MAG: class I SAM-dependent methyltransferase, partial [Fimbriimonadaceae bacterium]
MWKEIADNYEVERDKLSLPAILIDKIIVDLAMEDQLGPVLDFGAGSGTLARLLASRGRQVTAYEPNAPMREVLIRQTPAELSKHIRVVDNLDELPMESHFETILCVNVVDHLLDVHSTFRMFRSRVAPAGKLVLCIPHPMKNIGAWVKEGKKDAWDYVYYRLNDYMNEG